ncbi:MAG: accessory gene regulator B family protein [Clostridia bacterium]|nr:accessory gene regulator B family protein [Clostridia bacterium]
MIDKLLDNICEKINIKIRKEIPDIDEARLEVIDYGLKMIIGEAPKLVIMLLIAYILGVFKLTILSYIILLPYTFFAGGAHAKTHVACMIATPSIYCSCAILSKNVLMEINPERYIVIFAVWIFGIIMSIVYAPADTENVPILRKKERKFKKIMACIVLTISLIISVLLKNIVISNILIFGCLIRTVMMTRPIYILFKNKYGYEVYG